MVGRSTGDGARARQLCHLYDVSDFSKRVLSVRPWNPDTARPFVCALADVLAAVGAPQLGAALGVAGDVNPVDAGRISPDVLLLPQGVLPRVFLGSAGVRGR